MKFIDLDPTSNKVALEFTLSELKDLEAYFDWVEEPFDSHCPDALWDFRKAIQEALQCRL